MRPDAATSAQRYRPETAEQRELVRRELTRLLESRPFRGSKRCGHFLRFVVEETIEARYDSLRERTLGVEIFGRPPEYDTSLDAIVRVKANDVRRRLAQTYVELGAPLGLRIDVPPGAYIADFVWLPAPEPPAVPDAQPRSRRWWFGLAAGIVAAATGIGIWMRQPASPAERFWAPVLESPKPALICSGNPVVYGLSGRVHQRYRELHPERPPGPYVVDLPPEEITGGDVVPVVDQYVGVGDSLASGSLSALFARLGKPAQRRIGSDVSFTDLRTSPTILLGAFSNRWTIEMTRKLRVIFDQNAGGVLMIREQAAPFRAWALPQLKPGGRTNEDYAVVSRIFDSETGQPLIAAAGITQYGTQSAGEFLSDFAALSDALRDAPAGWEARDVQLVLHIHVIGRTPSRPQLVAAHFW